MVTQITTTESDRIKVVYSLNSMIFAIKETIFKRFGKGPKQLISSLHSAAQDVSLSREYMQRMK